MFNLSLHGDENVIYFFNPPESYLENKHLLAFHLRCSELGKLQQSPAVSRRDGEKKRKKLLCVEFHSSKAEVIFW